MTDKERIKEILEASLDGTITTETEITLSVLS